MFKLIDTDQSGNLSLEEVVLYLKSITDDISEDNIERIFEGIDTSGDKTVDFDEFTVSLYDCKGNRLSSPTGCDAFADR